MKLLQFQRTKPITGVLDGEYIVLVDPSNSFEFEKLKEPAPDFVLVGVFDVTPESPDDHLSSLPIDLRLEWFTGLKGEK